MQQGRPETAWRSPPQSRTAIGRRSLWSASSLLQMLRHAPRETNTAIFGGGWPAIPASTDGVSVAVVLTNDEVPDG